MIRLYCGCVTRRVTSTTIVLAILFDTTLPILKFLTCSFVCDMVIYSPSPCSEPSSWQPALSSRPEPSSARQQPFWPGQLSLKLSEPLSLPSSARPIPDSIPAPASPSACVPGPCAEHD